MHSDLATHLHSTECNELIQALKDCHQTKKFGRFLGQCNDVNTAMLRCLKKERESRRKANYEKSQALQQKLRDCPTHCTRVRKSFIEEMEVLDIEEEYLQFSHAEVKEPFKRFCNKDKGSEGYYRLNLHSNGMCFISLGPTHPVVKDEGISIASVEFSESRLNNIVKGKKKRGAQCLGRESHLCTIKTACGQSFLVRALVGGGKLIELNTELAEKPHQVKDSYIAILQSKWANVNGDEGIPDDLWIQEK